MSRARTALLRELRSAVPLFNALGDGTRLKLLAELAKNGPESIARLSEESHLTRQAITKHLVVLEGAGLVRGERRGREHLWLLEPQRLDEAHAYLELISRQWDERLTRLKEFAETSTRPRE